MKFKSWSFAIVGVVTLWYANAQDGIQLPNKTFRGASYLPQDDRSEIEKLPVNLLESYMLKTIYLPCDISDWESLKSYGSLRTESIQIFGFDKLGGKLLDQKVLQEDSPLFEIGVSPDYVLRLPESEIGRGSGGPGGGTYLGVLKFNWENDTSLVIGVGQTSFFLDVYYGTDRQAFFSNPLAEALKRQLKKHGIDLPQKTLESLSGMTRMKLPKEFDIPRTKE